MKTINKPKTNPSKEFKNSTNVYPAFIFSDQPMSFLITHPLEFIRIPAKLRKTLGFIVTFLIISPNSTLSQSSFASANDENYSDYPSKSVNKFEPSVAIFVGVLSIVFTLTLLTLIYVKCCHVSSSTHVNHENIGNLSRTRSRFSGIDKTVIESLPYFKFSTLKGWKNGLECSVCLSAFEDIELLRLLPKCKHAFHIDCIDQWLESHSSCPLCRVKVIKDDISLFACTNSLRFNESETSNLELFIAREGSSRFGTNVEDNHDQDQEMFYKFNHRIMTCNEHDPMMFKTRWSNVSSSDILFSKSDRMSTNRFDQLCLEVEKNPGQHRMIDEPRRSVSEITLHPRFLEGEVKVDEEKIRKVWLPIARKTVEMFANNIC